MHTHGLGAFGSAFECFLYRSDMKVITMLTLNSTENGLRRGLLLVTTDTTIGKISHGLIGKFGRMNSNTKKTRRLACYSGVYRSRSLELLRLELTTTDLYSKLSIHYRIQPKQDKYQVHTSILGAWISSSHNIGERE